MATLATLAEFAAQVKAQMLAALAHMGFAAPPDADFRAACVLYFKAISRTIPPRCRVVHSSIELSSRSLPAEHSTALCLITTESLAGLDLNPRLTRRFWNANFNDHLYTDWGIQHLHIGARDGGPRGMSKGTKELLFVMVRPEDIYFIDVADHDAFEDDALIDIVYENWPHVLEPYRYRATLYGGRRPTSQERADARKGGLTMPYQAKDGTLFRPPGGGQATSRDSIVAVELADAFWEEVTRFHAFCGSRIDEIAAQFEQLTHFAPVRLCLKIDFVNLARPELRLSDEATNTAVVPRIRAS